MPIAELANILPGIYKELHDTVKGLERHMKDMQDTEFTVQDGRLFMLQTRNGKRTGVAALRVAIEMEREGLVTPDEAVLMVEPRHLDQLLHPMFVNEKAYQKDGEQKRERGGERGGREGRRARGQQEEQEEGAVERGNKRGRLMTPRHLSPRLDPLTQSLPPS